MSFKPEFADRLERCNPSVIREILKVVAQPDIISFAGGMPAPDLFPYEAIEAASQRALAGRQMALASLQYGQSEGYLPLRRTLSESLASEGITAPVEQILITTGSQQALDMLAKLFLNPGDAVVVADPTFLGALQSFSSYEASYLTVPVDDEGMQVAPLDEVLSKHRAKLIYTIPNFQNPTGVSMSPERRLALYEVALRHGVPIVEDDPYGEIYFGAERPGTLKAFDREGGVVLLRTFSKVLAPGLRIGYMVLPQAMMTKILPLKQSADLHSSAFNQVLIHELLVGGEMPAHLAHLREVYRHRRDLMLAALEAHFPSVCTWTRPEGGMFTWVTLPEGLDAAKLLEEAVAHQVAFIPGEAFFAHGGVKNHFRLNFSNASEENIQEGIARLGAVLKGALRQAV